MSKSKNQTKKSSSAGNGDRKSPAGKGDKPRPCDYQAYSDGYDNINWDNSVYCCNCGATLHKENIENHPHLYIKYKNGEVECKSCNFN